jgi:hypothetical protein
MSEFSVKYASLKVEERFISGTTDISTLDTIMDKPVITNQD